MLYKINYFRYIIITKLLLAPLLTQAQEFMKHRTISFSNYTWHVKHGNTPMGPGENYFSGSPKSVFVDEQGLHLKILSTEKGWSAAEVYSEETFGYGAYTFKIIAPLDNLNPGVVFGLFLYNDALPPFHNEIDIEFTTWGGATQENGFYTIHGDKATKGKARFQFELSGSHTTHKILWTPDSIGFNSYHGHIPDMDKPIFTWTYKNLNLPIPVRERVHFNLWIFDKNKIDRQGEREVLIKSFLFHPL